MLMQNSRDSGPRFRLNRPANGRRVLRCRHNRARSADRGAGGGENRRRVRDRPLRSMSENPLIHWYPAYVGLGSNLNGPARQLDSAFELLAKIPRSRLVKRSALYRSAPFGGVEQPDFVNAVATMLTQLTAPELLLELQRIEQVRGRERGAVRWGPRVLDLDLLVYSNQEIDEDELTVPHPGIGERIFVLLPLEEVAPGLVIPGLGPLANISVSHNDAEISRIG